MECFWIWKGCLFVGSKFQCTFHDIHTDRTAWKAQRKKNLSEEIKFMGELIFFCLFSSEKLKAKFSLFTSTCMHIFFVFLFFTQTHTHTMWSWYVIFFCVFIFSISNFREPMFGFLYVYGTVHVLYDIFRFQMMDVLKRM